MDEETGRNKLHLNNLCVFIGIAVIFCGFIGREMVKNDADDVTVKALKRVFFFGKKNGRMSI